MKKKYIKQVQNIFNFNLSLEKSIFCSIFFLLKNMIYSNTFVVQLHCVTGYLQRNHDTLSPIWIRTVL